MSLVAASVHYSSASLRRIAVTRDCSALSTAWPSRPSSPRSSAFPPFSRTLFPLGVRGLSSAVSWERDWETRQSWWDSLPSPPPEGREGEVIHITLPDSSEPRVVRKGALPWTLDPPSWAVGVRVGEEVRDLHTPLESSHVITWEGGETVAGSLFLQHSAAHLLGGVWARRGGARLCHGPAVPGHRPYGVGGGQFYYEAVASPVSKDFHETVQREVSHLLLPYRLASHPSHGGVARKDIPIEEAQRLWEPSHPKGILLRRLAERGVSHVTVYRVGESIDLCRGPHVPHLGWLHSIVLTHFGSSQWEGMATQRMWGMAFPSAETEAEWRESHVTGGERDHREIGKRQHLWFAWGGAPGQPFFLPHGTRLIRRLQHLLQGQYARRGYEEVVTPQVLPQLLWEQSGHWAHYRADMFDVREGDGSPGGQLKPMNCPAHCLLFAQLPHSHRDLPLRYAEFGVLHRCERRGTLTGLTRVRRFMQDDAHIFCAPSQVGEEIRGCLDFMDYVYSLLGFKYDMELSTRPATFLGTAEEWDEAEEQLRAALRESGKEWKEQKGEGAFYGPKIDVHISDALGRRHQCATVQLDFQLPRRFDLSFAGPTGPARPVVIHRAILGSMERFLAVLTEHTGGKWPFWLSPRQCRILPVHSQQLPAAQEAANYLSALGYFVDSGYADSPLPGRVRDALTDGVTLVGVIGPKEPPGHVSLRHRDGRQLGSFSLSQLAERFAHLTKHFEEP